MEPAILPTQPESSSGSGDQVAAPGRSVIGNRPFVRPLIGNRRPWVRLPTTTSNRDEDMDQLSKALRANDLAAVDSLITSFVAKGYTIHQLSPILFQAVAVDNAEFAEKLLRRQIVLTHSYVRAAVKSRAKRCLELFSRYGFDINKPECATRPPAWTYLTDNREMVYWLLEHGANLNVHGECDFTTVMSGVVEVAPPDLIRDLLDDPRHLVDVYKGDLLHHALDRKTDDIAPVLAMLLDHGAPINEGLYARHLASQNMYFFMPRGPPLHKAAEKGQLDAVRFLLSRHADVSIRDTQGKTALFYAEKKGHTEIVEVLQKAMAEFKTQHL
ncbi:hypothetical protein SBRCBS47491_005109 [Sporothrix bragantina]|uniref:Ankyrin repeat protein n=1 Tax=Sporothrix bragantina TaxID=671064 RepID=A0ABP0BUR8_9PEZI